MIQLRDTLLIRLGFVALTLIAMFATFGLVLQIAHQTEEQIGQRLAHAEMTSVQDKVQTLSGQQQVVEIATIVNSRFLAAQLARGARFNSPNQQVVRSNMLHCATPQRDQSIIAARFDRLNLPGEPTTRFAGTPLDWSKIAEDWVGNRQIQIPAGAACNARPVAAQVVIAKIGTTIIVTGWMTETLPQLAIKHWVPASLGFAVLLGLGLCTAVLSEQRARWQMRQLMFALKQVGQGDFDTASKFNIKDREYKQLSRTISAMARQLKGMQAGLMSLMDRTAHDLRTPLARAIARIDRVISNQSNPKDKQDLQAVEADLRDLSSRFGAMLALRHAATIDPTQSERIDLAEIAQMAAELYQDLDIGATKTITLNLAPAWVRAERGLIQNAVANLLDNALRFSPDQGEVQIATWSDGNAAILTIADTGFGLDIGANSQQSEIVFEAGFTTRAEDGGYGLGLTTVREVAKRYGGTITLKNREKRRGAIATLSFPTAL